MQAPEEEEVSQSPPLLCLSSCPQEPNSPFGAEEMELGERVYPLVEESLVKLSEVNTMAGSLACALRVRVVVVS